MNKTLKLYMPMKVDVQGSMNYAHQMWNYKTWHERMPRMFPGISPLQIDAAFDRHYTVRDQNIRIDTATHIRESYERYNAIKSDRKAGIEQ